MIDVIKISEACLKQARISRWAAENFKDGFKLIFNEGEALIDGPGVAITLQDKASAETIQGAYQIAAKPGTFPTDKADDTPVSRQQNIYQAAVDVQNACNSRGILRTLIELLPAIVEDAQSRGDASTTAINQHPVILAFLDKLLDLGGITHVLPSSTLAAAHTTCTERAKTWKQSHQA